MKVKVFQPNRNGKIEFTRAELEKLLNEIYEEGRKDAPISWGSPFVYSTPDYNLTGGISLCSVDKADATIDNLTCTNKTDGAKAISISMATPDLQKLPEAVDSIITNSVRDYYPKNAFDALAKELNF